MLSKLALHRGCDGGGCSTLSFFFYAGLSKEVSASDIFLGQGSSSCAKTLP